MLTGHSMCKWRIVRTHTQRDEDLEKPGHLMSDLDKEHTHDFDFLFLFLLHLIWIELSIHLHILTIINF